METLEPLYTAGMNLNRVATLENSLAIPQKVKQEVTIWLSNSIPR